MPGEAEISFEEATGVVSTPPHASPVSPSTGEISFAEAAGPQIQRTPISQRMSENVSTSFANRRRFDEVSSQARGMAFTQLVGGEIDQPSQGFWDHAGKTALRGVRALVQSPTRAAVGGVKALTGGVISMGESAVAGVRGLGRAAGQSIIKETLGRVPAHAATAPMLGAVRAAGSLDPVSEGVAGIEESMEQTGQLREMVGQITKVNLAAENEQEQAMEGLLMLIPEGIAAAGDTVYEQTGSALAGAGTQGLLTLLTFKPGIAGKVVESSVKSVKSKELFNTTFDALAISEPDSAKAIIDHVAAESPKTAQKLRARMNQTTGKWEPVELGEKVVKQQTKGKEITAEEAGIGLSEAAAETPKVEPKPTPKPVEARPELLIDEDLGQFEIKSPAGEFLAQENGKYLQVKRADVVAEERGRGHAQVAMNMLADEATKRGLTLGSDFSVSPDAQRVYEALARKGFDVKENPNAVNPVTGNKVSANPRIPVYEVTKKAEPAQTPPAQSGRVYETPEFKEWFSGSQIVDTKGTPATLYHGTTGDFGKFSRLFAGRGHGSRDWGKGFYFTDSPKAAATYAEKPGGNIRPVHLRITKPADNKVMMSKEVQRALDEEGGMGFTDVREVLEKKGYDGIVFTHRDGAKEYVVFRADQIKSALAPEKKINKAKSVKEPASAVADSTATAADAAKVEQIFVSGPTLDALPGGEFIKGKMAAWWDELIRTVNPEALGPKAKQSAAILANKIAETMNRDAANHGMAIDRIKFWDKTPEAIKSEFIRTFESGKPQATPELQKVADYMRQRNKDIFAQDQRNGVKYDPQDNYLYHIFDNAEKLAEHFQTKYGAKWGDPKFTKDRQFELYDEAIKAGYRPKFTNPEEIMLMRQHASDVAQMQVELLRDLESYGLAKRKTKGDSAPPKTGSYTYRRSPNGEGYWVEQSADAILHNAFDTKSLWNMPGIRGDLFKGAMFLKNSTIPIVLSLSLFHPLHLLLGMDQGAAMTRLTKDMLVSGGNPVKWFGKWLEQMTLGSKGIPFYGIVDNPRTGFRLLKAYQGKVDPAKLTAADRTALQYMNEGGFIPEMSSQYRSGAIENFGRAIREVAAEYNGGKGDLRKVGGKVAKAGFYTPFAIIDAMQYPMFRLWIPALKIASYLKDVQTALKVDPSLATDKARRLLAFRKLSKSVDNRYGEMAYNTLFWNRTIKDIAVANTLSLGWNLGFLREYGGGAMDIGQSAVKKGSLAERARRGDLDRPLFVMFYTTQVMLYSGLLTWALTGTPPQDFIDYLYPKSGDKDPKGNDIRLNTPFYPREFAAIAKHVEHEGLGPGMWHVVSNKSSGVIGLVNQWATGTNWMGQEVRDPNSAWHQQLRDTIGATLGDLEPISVGSLRQGEGTAKEAMFAFSGFNRAPKYVTQSSTEAKVSTLYRKYYAPQQTPYETALLSNDRRKLAKLYSEGKVEAYGELLDEMTTKYDLTASEQGRLARNIMNRGVDYNPYLTMFERLTWQQQKRLLDNMTPDERTEYLPHSNKDHLRYTYEEPE